YISHLDLVRCMARALKRSGLPVWYTQGFNPHIYLTFTLPLSLGQESECEIMQFRLVEELPLNEVKDRLNAALPAGLQVLATALPQQDQQAIAAADYRVS
ncbi:TIGR03936 family radical SAM-associated protein, partial [Bittarella massiliensis (ex Durand et al. 2017)]